MGVFRPEMSASLAIISPGQYAFIGAFECSERDILTDAECKRCETYAGADDAQLMAWTVAGNRVAFDALAGRHLKRAYRTALRIVGNGSDAEDVAQEAMVRAWKNARSWDVNRSQFTTWLYRITVNLAIDRRRRPRPLPLDAAGDPADPAQGAAARLESQELGAALADALAAMPERQRAALTLTYYEGLSGKEAAEALSVSVRGLEGLLRRGRIFLKDRLLGRGL